MIGYPELKNLQNVRNVARLTGINQEAGINVKNGSCNIENSLFNEYASLHVKLSMVLPSHIIEKLTL